MLYSASVLMFSHVQLVGNNLLDCTPPGCPWNFPSRNTVVGCHFLSRRPSWPRDRPCISCASCIGRRIIYHHATWESLYSFTFSSVTQSRLTLLIPRTVQHTRLPCPSPTPRAWSNSCPLSQWCHSTNSSSVIPFSSCPQSFPASGSFPMS